MTEKLVQRIEDPSKKYWEYTVFFNKLATLGC